MTNKNRLIQSYNILEKLRLPHGLYLASPSIDYSFVWIRDTFYEVLPYLNSNCSRYEDTYHSLLDIFKEYEWKIELHNTIKPTEKWQYIHAKYDAHTLKEVEEEWGHAQHDSIGAILFGISEGLRVGKPIVRDEQDRALIHKIVNYLACCEYWSDPDNGMWEEWQEVHSSSVGAVVGGLIGLSKQGFNIPQWLIQKGEETLSKLLPYESNDRAVDLSQLSLIYPYRVVGEDMAKNIVRRVETLLLREKGVARYLGDSYYSTLKDNGRNLPLNRYYGTEAEWTFGLTWLALCHMELGNYYQAQDYISKAELTFSEDGSLPELFYAFTDKPNGNTPLGWSNSMYILAKEAFVNKSNKY